MNAHRWNNRRAAAGLIGLNVALLGALAFVTFGAPVFGQGFRARGNYVAVAGNASGFEPAVIYIADETNEQLIAIMYDPNTKALSGVGARDLASDASQLGRPRN